MTAPTQMQQNERTRAHVQRVGCRVRARKQPDESKFGRLALAKHTQHRRERPR